MEAQIASNEFCISSVAFDEVNRKIPDCGTWLRDIPIQIIDIDAPILQEALRIKQLLGIQNDNYHANGVGENDILIIGACRINGIDLISDERRQLQAPQIMAKRKIPAVCGLPAVNVPCTNILEMIKQ
jgi:hypothetical protein